MSRYTFLAWGHARRVLGALLLLAAIAGTAGPPVAARAAAACCARTAGTDAAATLGLLNAIRADRGLPALAADPRLERAARRHAADMVARRYFAHTSPAGRTLVDRIAATGWMHGRPRWLVGENLAWGTASLAGPEAIVAAWMHSAGHRETLLDRRFCAVGVAIANGTPVAGAGTGATYVTDFGSGVWRPRRGTGPHRGAGRRCGSAHRPPAATADAGA